MKEGLLTLSDGRNLAYAEYGDLHGKPVILFPRRAWLAPLPSI